MKILNKTEDSLKSQTAILFTGRLFVFVISFITPVFLARILTKNDYGLYRLSMVLSSTLLSILDMGITASLYYFYPNSNGKRLQLLSQTFYALLLIGSIGLMIGLAMQRPIENYFSIESENYLVIQIILITFFLLISSVIEVIFILEKKAILNALYIIGSQIVRSLFVIFPAFYFRDVKYVLWGVVLFTILRTLFYLSYIKKNYGGFCKISESSYLLKQIKYALPLGGGFIIDAVNKKIDSIFVSLFKGVGNFATYSIATFNIPLLGLFFLSVFQVGMPKLSLYGNASDILSAKYLWHKMIFTAAMIAIPSAVFFEVMAEPIITVLFTEKYIDSVLPYRIFLLIVFFQISGYGLISRAFNRTNIYLKAGIYALIASLVFGIGLIILFGIVGAAISAVFTFGVYAGVILYEEKKILNLKFSEWLPFNELGYLLFMSLICALPVILFNIIFKKLSYFITLPTSFVIYTLPILSVYYAKSYFSIENIKAAIKEQFVKSAG